MAIDAIGIGSSCCGQWVSREEAQLVALTGRSPALGCEKRWRKLNEEAAGRFRGGSVELGFEGVVE